LQPPGVYHSLAKHQTQKLEKHQFNAVHEQSVSLVFEGDWVQHFDSHGGLVQTMVCDSSASSVQLGCHLLEGAICHLLHHCGDEAERFSACQHLYEPRSKAVELWTLMTTTFRESLRTFSFWPIILDYAPSLLVAGFAVSAVGVGWYLGISRIGFPKSLYFVLVPA
jgi:hypothetical protein